MAKKTSTVNMIIIIPLLCIFFFILGIIAANFLPRKSSITTTGFRAEYKRIYENQIRKRGWETHVDLINRFSINYPDFYHLENYCFSQQPERVSVSFWHHQDENVMYNDKISLSSEPLNENLLEYAKRKSTYSIENTDVSTYKETNINGNPVVISDFVMNKQLFDSETELNKHRNRQISLQPIGFHRKTAFIKSGDRVFVLESGSLYEDYQEQVFETMIQSLKFYP